MNIFLSSMTIAALNRYSKCKPNCRINILRSFAYESKPDMRINNSPNVDYTMLDSGAYSLNNSQYFEKSKKNNIFSYCNYLSAYSSHYSYYFNFDIDFSGNWRGINKANLELLQRSGLNPIPVVHAYTDDELDYYIDNGFKR